MYNVDEYSEVSQFTVCASNNHILWRMFQYTVTCMLRRYSRTTFQELSARG